jgi:hypothetical protein
VNLRPTFCNDVRLGQVNPSRTNQLTTASCPSRTIIWFNIGPSRLLPLPRCHGWPLKGFDTLVRAQVENPHSGSTLHPTFLHQELETRRANPADGPQVYILKRDHPDKENSQEATAQWFSVFSPSLSSDRFQDPSLIAVDRVQVMSRTHLNSDRNVSRA